jgi:hypothetical protein
VLYGSLTVCEKLLDAADLLNNQILAKQMCETAETVFKTVQQLRARMGLSAEEEERYLLLAVDVERRIKLTSKPTS